MRIKTKVTGLIIPTLLVLSLMSFAAVPTVKAHTESGPYTIDLVAGKYTDVGDVLVWNDGGYLYVKYVTTGDWYMSEVHLMVAESLTGILR